jgi:hypothetical protein
MRPTQLRINPSAELVEAILEVIERTGRHAWLEVVELCAHAKTGGCWGRRSTSQHTRARTVRGAPDGARVRR